MLARSSCISDGYLSLRYWPVLDNALRTAAFDNGVHVRLLAGMWKHTRSDMVYYLRSLQDLNGIVDERK